jgi:ribosomal protein S18 acetylase RimI-like enzyme
MRTRWMIRADMPSVFKIEQEYHTTPWVEEDFLVNLRQRNIIGMVAVGSSQTLAPVKAYVIYKLERTNIVILSIAGSPEGIRQLLAAMRRKRDTYDKTSVSYRVREASRALHTCFVNEGFTLPNNEYNLVCSVELSHWYDELLAHLPAELHWDRLIETGLVAY